MESLNKRDLIDTLFSHVAEGIIVCNNAGKILLSNPASQKFFGYTESELAQLTIEDLIPENIRGKHAAYREQFQANRRSRAMGKGLDLYAKKKDGTHFPVEISLSPLDLDGALLVVAFIIDITIRKQIELSVQEKQKELEKVAAALIATNEGLEKKVSDRTKVLQEAIRELEKSRSELSYALEKEKDLNDLKNRFISMASHEFRTPLTTILSSATLIGEYEQAIQEEKKKKHIQRIKSAVGNLNDILSDFLSISKLEEGKVNAEMRTFDVRKLVQEITSDMQLNTKPGQMILYHHSGDSEVILDSKLLKNIFINLISNGIKFTPENKIITVSTRKDDYTFSMEVRDEGIGISDEDQKHLFERFYRGKNATNIQGTGLGLHIVGSYVDLMNGHIILQSELNKGTSIKITFPNQKPEL